MNDIGFKIKKIRELNNISQEELAINLNISQSNLSKIENGRIRKIDFALLMNVCKCFDIQSDFFLERTTLVRHQPGKKISFVLGFTITNFSDTFLLLFAS